MGLIGKLKNMSQRAGSAAHDGIAKVFGGWGDAESRLRQRMRIHPKRPKLWGTQVAETGEALRKPTPDLALVVDEEPTAISAQPRKPIVSINGKDVEGDQLEQGAA